MSSGVPILPALGTMDGPHRLHSYSVKQLQPHSPRDALQQLTQSHHSTASAGQTLPPISSLSGPSRSPTGSPASLASSDDVPTQANDTSFSAAQSAALSRQRGSASSDEVIETMDTDEDGHSGAPYKSHSGHPRMPMGVPSPTWTNRWTSRAPPPKPLDTKRSPRSLVSPLGIPSVMAPVSGRHHPYGARTSGAVTPSPTWPAHIGLEDANAPPHSAGSHPHYSTRPSPPRQPYSDNTPSAILRRRASTLAEQGAGGSAGPHRSAPQSQGASRTAPRLTQRASMESLEQQRRLGGRAAPGEYQHAGYHSPAYPPSPLLFSPITPWSAEHHASPVYPSPMYPQGQLHGGQDGRMLSAGARYGGNDSPHAYNNSLQLSLHDQQQQHQHHLQIEHGRRPTSYQQPGLSPPTHSQAWGASHPQAQSEPTAAPPLERFSQTRRRRRPPYSYSSLIAQAITSSPESRMTLREIYTWISNAYPELYSMDGPDSQGWQNTVRHNLSLNRTFVKVARTAQDIYDSCASSDPAHSQAARGKGGWWTIDPSSTTSRSLLLTPGGADTSPLPSRSPNGFSGDEYFPSPAPQSAKVLEGGPPNVALQPAPTASAHRRSSLNTDHNSAAKRPQAVRHQTSTASIVSDPVHPKTMQLPSVLRPRGDTISGGVPTVVVGLGFESADSSTRPRAYSRACPPRSPPHTAPATSASAPGIENSPPLLQSEKRAISAPEHKREEAPEEKASGRKMDISGLLC
ncbi:hypothetical protein BCV69DRAFT_279962 [Microstroma glucosiphilum]|uniref:Fork-head domain-containing protein n=1 Tax=Pseudomicrostroma glucosiphilum TaxID=1684307 RepID=A0A316UFQ7_9BASI|nr:hypothetical protein BCV69DRAFT_279962 [Pseudomicrostroma glucosiphilum]PWN24060.1 hypothetical protein BCV69DRAFT_279962 [Pseudomicrostroma glucosiphilum]